MTDSSQSDSTLARALAHYRHQLELVQHAQNQISDTDASVRDLVDRVWKMEPRDDDTGQKHEGRARYQEKQALLLKDMLGNLRKDISVTLYQQLFEAKMARLSVQWHIDDCLWQLRLRPVLLSKGTSTDDKQQQQHDWDDDRKTLERLLSDCFEAAERSGNELAPFLEDVHLWVLHIGACFLRLCRLPDQKFLLLHLLRSSPGVSQWAMPLVQYHDPPPTFLDAYVDALDLMLTETTRWSEEDYIACLDQFSVIATVEKMMADKLFLQKVDAQQQQLFAFAHRLVSVLGDGIRAFAQKSYTNAMKRLGQILCRLAQTLLARLNDNGLRTEYQQSVDDLVRDIVNEYLTSNYEVLHFMPALPFHLVSVPALSSIARRLLGIREQHDSALQDLPDISGFYSFLAQNQRQGIFMLGCLSSIVTGVSAAGQEDSAATSLITVVSHVLFNVAFVNTVLRDTYYKEVRDSFGNICSAHPWIISLLLRWTCEHFATMEGMALYLFRSLPIRQWRIDKEDIVRLHQLLDQKGTQATLSRYIIERLNFGYSVENASVSQSQPWSRRKRTFLSYDIHEAIAFLLVDLARAHYPLPESEKSAHMMSAIASTIMASTQQILLSSVSSRPNNNDSGEDLLDWIWKIALQLKLYDCPVSAHACEIEGIITRGFLRDMLHADHDSVGSHGALLVYICFLLSSTSRHFLRFESADGWDKLLLILRRGKPEAAMRALAEIVPGFVYMHGDDFFNDASPSAYLGQMVDLKTDPMLAKAAAAFVSQKLFQQTPLNGIDLVIGSHVWQGVLIDSVMDDLAGGFSYRDLMLHSWIKTVFRRQGWMWRAQYVSVMDTLCKFCFCLSRHDLVRNMLLEEHRLLLESSRQQQQQSVGSANHQSEQQQQRNPLRLIKNMLPDGAYHSLLAGEWSLVSLIMTTNNLFRTPGVEQHSLWFAFDTLSLETRQEKEYRLLIVKHLQSHSEEDKDVIAVLKAHTSNSKPIEFLAIYRWLQHILVCPPDHVLLPLFLQTFFCLYYANVQLDDRRRVFYGPLFFAKKQDQIARLRDRIAYLQTYQGQQQQRPSSSSEALRQIYYAMWLWLDEDDHRLLQDNNNLASHYCPDKLQSCIQACVPGKEDEWENRQPWVQISNLWLDLVDYPSMEQAFKEFPWIGSEKFR